MINHIRYLEVIHIHLSFDYLPGLHNLLIWISNLFFPTIHSVNWWSRWWTWTTKTRTGGSIHVIPMISQDISDEILHPPKEKHDIYSVQCFIANSSQLLDCFHFLPPRSPNGSQRNSDSQGIEGFAEVVIAPSMAEGRGYHGDIIFGYPGSGIQRDDMVCKVTMIWIWGYGIWYDGICKTTKMIFDDIWWYLSVSENRGLSF